MTQEQLYSLEAEKAVLGVIIVKDCVDICINDFQLCKEDFYDKVNAEIFSEILNIYDENKAVDIVVLSERLRSRISDISYINEIVSMTVTSSHLSYYCEILKDLSYRRKCIDNARKIYETASDSKNKIEFVKSEINKLDFDDVAVNKSINDLAVEAYNEVVTASQNHGMLPGVATGFTDLDAAIGGLENSNFIIVGARPAMGKSVFATNIAEFVSRDKLSVIFSLEMSAKQVLKRMMSSISGVNYSDCRFGTLENEDFAKISTAMNNICNRKIDICDKAVITTSYIKSYCRALKKKYGEIGCVIIDYLQLITSPNASQNRNNDISEISRNLKLLAKELDCPVVALSQLSRMVDTRADKRPVLSDLRESGAIEQDADTVLFLYRDDYYNPDKAEKGVSEVIIAKAREGKTGTIKLFFKPQCMRFMNLEYVN